MELVIATLAHGAQATPLTAKTRLRAAATYKAAITITPYCAESRCFSRCYADYVTPPLVITTPLFFADAMPPPPLFIDSQLYDIFRR